MKHQNFTLERRCFNAISERETLTLLQRWNPTLPL